METHAQTTRVDTTPFFIATGEGKGVAVSKAAAQPNHTDGAQVYELLDAKELHDVSAVAEFLSEMICKATKVSNPLLADEDWGSVANDADGAGVAMLFSAPPSERPALVELAGVARTLKADWIAELPGEDDAALFDGVSLADETRAWVWKSGGRTFASRLAPPDDDRVTILRKGTAPREELQGLAERSVRLLKGAAPGAVEERYVLGVVLEPETVDSQGDIYSAEEIRRACHTFMADYQNVGHQHKTLVNGAVRVVECYIAPVDFGEGETAAKAGSWLLGLNVRDDELWRQVKAGELTGLSIGGFAQRVPA